MNKKKGIRIGELARRAGVTPRTIRFYVEEGLLPQPARPSKNIAYYGFDCIEKIKAIKKAQSSRYLPLEVIRRILEQNDFDYAALNESRDEEEREKRLDIQENGTAPLTMPDIPRPIIDEITRRKWIKPERGPNAVAFDRSDLYLLNLMDRLNKQGIPWDELFAPLDAIQKLIEQAVDLESQTLIGWVMKNPSLDFNEVFELEGMALNDFFQRIRETHLRKTIQRHKKALDNAYLASSDEGFALPPEVMEGDLRELESRLRPRSPNVRILVDLATGYSCLGELDQSKKYIRRALRVLPDDPEINVRWIYYNRFSSKKGENEKLKKQLAEITAANPDYALGHAFLAGWHAFDIPDSGDHHEVLKGVKLCLRELEKAENGRPANLHDWMLIHYIKGKIFMLPSLAGYRDKGLAAFEKILSRGADLEEYYSERMPFFPKWLWPNLLFFLGTSYLTAGMTDQAAKCLQKCRNYNMLAPYGSRVQEALASAESDLHRIDKGGDDD